MDQRDVVVVAEHGHDLFALTQPHQAVIHINAGELVADGFVNENGSHGGIHTTGEAADHALCANLFADLADHFGAVGSHRPVGFQADDLVHEVGKQLCAIRRVHH